MVGLTVTLVFPQVSKTFASIGWLSYYIPRRKLGIYWFHVRRAAAVRFDLCSR